MSLNQHITNVLDSALHAEDHGAPRVPRWLPAALVTHVVVTLVCVAAAIVLLVAWYQGW